MSDVEYMRGYERIWLKVHEVGMMGYEGCVGMAHGNVWESVESGDVGRVGAHDWEFVGMRVVSRVACCVSRVACRVLRVACCVLIFAYLRVCVVVHCVYCCVMVRSCTRGISSDRAYLCVACRVVLPCAFHA
jgi:hypothetical protein